MPEWTQEQKSAIEDRGGTLLVSAAAGSGKTAVLTERVLRRVTDPENPIDITELLLVTFTRAAAAEMRERIAAAIGAAVAQDPSSVRLRRQLFLVHRAKITTVHALCMSLAREQAAALGIAPMHCPMTVMMARLIACPGMTATASRLFASAFAVICVVPNSAIMLTTSTRPS